MALRSKKLKLFRIRYGVKLAELAHLTGISISTLSMIENNWRPLKEAEAEQLLHAYKKLNIHTKELAKLFMGGTK